MPVFCFLDFDKIIPDVLHLLLRITEKQVQALIRDVSGDKKALQKMITELTAIFHPDNPSAEPYQPYDKNGDIARPHFTGGLVGAVCDNIESLCIRRKGESEQHYQTKLRVCTLLKEICRKLNYRTLTKPEIQNLKFQIALWGKLFIQRLGSRDFANSAHVLCAHVPHYLDLHGSLEPFSQQGVEKKVQTLEEYSKRRSCPRQNIPKILLQYDNRMARRIVSDYQSQVVTDRCGACKEVGHRKSNKRCSMYSEYKAAKKQKE